MLNRVSDEIKSKAAPANGAKPNPTAATYGGLDRAYEFFNNALFGGQLPRCLITYQRHKGAYGYFAPQRFGSRDGSTVTDEIALNPMHFAERDEKSTLSTLVHEMAHLWQQHFGKPSRAGYHNKEWAAKVKELGLHPSGTAAPGGKETGQRVSHYIVEGGAFDRAFAEFGGGVHLFGDLWNEADEKAAKRRAKKAASKTAFVCPACAAKAWAKPDAKLMCGDCTTHDSLVHMVCDGGD